MSQFKTPDFLAGSSIYEVNLRQFSPEGTIAAFRRHLPRIRDMGAGILWFMPIHPIGFLNRKGSLGSYYSVKDFTDVNPEFGTREDFRNMVIEAHALGMKVVIDWIANHTAWDSVWAINHPEYFVKDDQGNFISPYDWTDAIQIDHSNTGEQDAMISAMEYWVREFDIDGFRTDLAHLTPLPFWVRARKQIDAIKPSLIWLGETEETAYFDAFDIGYAWKWMHFSESFIKEGMPVSRMVEFLKKQSVDFPPDKFLLYFTSNHDENTWNGTEYEKYGVYAKALAVFCFTWQNSVPMIYGSQEIPNHKRLPFFDKDTVHWPSYPALQDFYKTLMHYRKSAIPEAPCHFIDAPEGLLAYRKQLDALEAIVVLNLGKSAAGMDIALHASSDYREIFSGEAVSMLESLRSELEPGEYQVWVRVPLQ